MLTLKLKRSDGDPQTAQVISLPSQLEYWNHGIMGYGSGINQELLDL